ncbi:MAG: acetate--CoA ligase family protein [Candidatus Sumerlaeia bacterium]|nr:acetate--CoA ligase family protein [Candidatus Sumerlaeia bacterium]
MVTPSELDFEVSKFAFFDGPSYWLQRRAMVFNLFIDPTGYRADYYLPEVAKAIPSFKGKQFDRMIDLFVAVLMEALRLDINLHITEFALHHDDEEEVVAVEYVDEETAIECAFMVRDFFRALNAGDTFDWAGAIRTLQTDFDKALLGGPTIYSLVEAGWKQNIPVLYLDKENTFQWGYGCKGVRGRSTVFHTDSVKDTEFTTFKDRVKDFLAGIGFPVPIGETVYTIDEALEAAEEIGFPVVVKPVAGHKGQGVSTNLKTPEQVEEAMIKILPPDGTEVEDGAIVERYITGSDYRLLAVDGKFVAALHREPAHVMGDGYHTIEELILEENKTEKRKDTIRSPLCKILIDDTILTCLKEKGMSLSTVPDKGERVNLRKIANISAGGVSINETERIHPLNKQLVESIAGFFQVQCLGIDVITEDISKPWTAGNFGIIEINAGPGVFMHTAPAVGGGIDVPAIIMKSFFSNPCDARIPLIVGNQLSSRLCTLLMKAIQELKPKAVVGTLCAERGISLNGNPLVTVDSKKRSIVTLLRHPRVEFALISHDKDSIFDSGTVHEGADVVILREPHYAEEILAREVLPEGLLIRVETNEQGIKTLVLIRHGERLLARTLEAADDEEALICELVVPHLPAIISRYHERVHH